MQRGTERLANPHASSRVKGALSGETRLAPSGPAVVIFPRDPHSTDLQAILRYTSGLENR